MHTRTQAARASKQIGVVGSLLNRKATDLATRCVRESTVSIIHRGQLPKPLIVRQAALDQRRGRPRIGRGGRIIFDRCHRCESMCKRNSTPLR